MTVPWLLLSFASPQRGLCRHCREWQHTSLRVWRAFHPEGDLEWIWNEMNGPDMTWPPIWIPWDRPNEGGPFLSAVFMWRPNMPGDSWHIHSHMGTRRDGHLFCCKIAVPLGKSPKPVLTHHGWRLIVFHNITQTCREHRWHQHTLRFWQLQYIHKYIYIYIHIITYHAYTIEIAAAVFSRIPEFMFNTVSSSMRSAILQYKVGLLACCLLATSFESPCASSKCQFQSARSPSIFKITCNIACLTGLVIDVMPCYA